MIPFDFDDQDKPAPSPTGDAAAGQGAGRAFGRRARDEDADVISRDLDDAEDEDQTDDDEDDWDDEDDPDDDESDDRAGPVGVATATGARLDDDPAGAGSASTGQIRQYLVELSKDELVAFVERLAAQDAAVQRAVAEQVANARGPTAELLRGARATIDDISAGAIYEGDEPSGGEIGRLRDRFEALIARGRADDVLLLCQRLVRHANRAVEAMEEADEGFFEAIRHVLDVVPEALVRSPKSPVEQILWLFEFGGSAEYDLTPDMADFWDLERPVEVWNELAARVEERLAASGPVSPSSAYGVHSERDSWTSLLADALQNAGRGAEIVPLYEREAELTGSYQRLVTYLLEVGNLERAEHWIRRGIAAMPGQYPGIVSQLRRGLHTIRERQGDLAGIAALDAYEFFERPGPGAFQSLLNSAEVAGCREPVRLHALRFLETLTLPWSREDAQQSAAASSGATGDGSGGGAADGAVDLPPWPLPPTGLPDPAPPRYEQPPLARVLLDIALAEERLGDVLAWYDRLRTPRPGAPYHSLGYGAPDATVARAVERSHPERAIAIWEELAERAIARTNTEAYLEAARYLDSAGRIEERRGNLAAWRQRVLTLRERERRKWRLRETLDDLLKRFPPA